MPVFAHGSTGWFGTSSLPVPLLFQRLLWCLLLYLIKVEQLGPGPVPPGTGMNGVVKQDRSDNKSAPSGNEEEKGPREKAASEVRDGTKLQPPPFAERKNGKFLAH